MERSYSSDFVINAWITLAQSVDKGWIVISMFIGYEIDLVK